MNLPRDVCVLFFEVWHCNPSCVISMCCVRTCVCTHIREIATTVAITTTKSAYDIVRSTWGNNQPRYIFPRKTARDTKFPEIKSRYAQLPLCGRYVIFECRKILLSSSRINWFHQSASGRIYRVDRICTGARHVLYFSFFIIARRVFFLVS